MSSRLSFHFVLILVFGMIGIPISLANNLKQEVTKTITVRASKNLYDNTLSSKLFHEWNGFGVTLTGYVSKISVDYKWKDQGWGNRKGHIQLRAYNGNELVIVLPIAGTAPHSWATVTDRNVESSRLDKLKPGMKLKLFYVIGQSGGHALYVDNFKAKITYYLKEVSKTIVATKNLYDNKVSGAFHEFNGFKYTLPGKVSKISVSYKWKDQGWGNRKGYIMLYGYDGEKVVARLHICSGSAPHSWATVNNRNVAASELSNLGPGIVLKLVYVVGASGGHTLYVNDFKAIITYYVGSLQENEQEQDIDQISYVDERLGMSSVLLFLIGSTGIVGVGYKLYAKKTNNEEELSAHDDYEYENMIKI